MTHPDFDLPEPTEPTQAMREIEKAIDAFGLASFRNGAHEKEIARARLVRLIEEAMK